MANYTWEYENSIATRIREYSEFDEDVIYLESDTRLTSAFTLKKRKVRFEGNSIDNENYVGFTFNYCRFHDRFALGGLTIANDFRLNHSLFENQFTFLGGTIKSFSYFIDSHFLEYAWFDSIIFEGNVTFADSIFRGDLKFKDCTFKGEVIFFNCQFCSNVFIENCTFEGSVDFRTSDLNKQEITFQKEIKGYFGSNDFYEKVIFHNRSFGMSRFFNSKFRKLVDFFNTDFIEPICFNKVDFEGTTVFSRTTFHQEVLFLYTQVSSNMVLRDTDFKKGVNFAPINIIGNGFLNIFNLQIESFKSIANSNAGPIDMQSNWFNISHEHKRETYRILKNEAIKQNNKIKALDFHAEEMEAYRLELKEYAKWHHKDRLIMSFNRFTNYYGLRWGRGFWITLGISISFFIIYYLSLKAKPVCFSKEFDFTTTCKSIGVVLGYYAQFFNPSHRVSFMAEYLGNWSAFWDIVSRVFIGLGLYQTIQAFRKYGRF